MFLFSCYTGLRFSDVQALEPNCFDSIEDEQRLTFTQQKTNKVQRLPLHLLFDGKAVGILSKYIDKNKEFVFPRTSNQEANRTLKSIQIIVGLDKTLTFHKSRHTFGTQLAKATNDPFLIKELMGHADIKTSMIYIHLNEKALDDKLKNVKW